MRIIENLVDLIAPLICIRCNTEGAIVCEACINANLIYLPSCCFYCNKITQNFKTCNLCMNKSALNSVWCVSDYNSIAQEIVRTYKYDAIRGARKTIVCEMLNALPVLDVIVTNVPTATSRVRQRGFDHCSLIAKDVAKSRNLTYASLLYRTGSSHQVGSTKAERIKQAKGLFYSRNPAFIKNKRILLVDDVATTGATLESAARALKNAGAIEVFGLVFAKKT